MALEGNDTKRHPHPPLSPGIGTPLTVPLLPASNISPIINIRDPQ
jgi:hypothetical protein